MVRCPGCSIAVSEWAGRCPACGTGLAAAPALDPRPGRDGRERLARAARLAGAAALVAVIVAAVVEDGAPRPGRTGTSTTTTGAPPPTTEPGPGRLAIEGGPRRGQLAYAERLGGVRIVDLATGRSEWAPVDADPYPARLFAVGRSFVFLADGEVWTVADLVAGDAVEPDARLLGPADSALRGDQPGTLWLVTGTPPRPVEATLVTLGGQRSSGPVALPAGTAPVAAVAPGQLVLQRRGDRTLLLYDTASGLVADGLGRPGDVVDAHGRLVAWLAGGDGVCSGSCTLHLSDLAERVERVVAPPPGLAWFGGGALSPDGRTLAAFAGPAGRDGDGSARLVLVDVATAGAVVVPGSDVPVGEPVGAAAWSATSGWVLFSGLGGGMRAHLPGAGSARWIGLPPSYAFAVS